MLAATSCPGCGSDDLGRGHCRTRRAVLLRDVTPLRRFRCRACGREGWTLRPLPRSRHPDELLRSSPSGRRPGRSAERRDRASRWRGAARLALSVALALLLGALAANRLVSCQSQPPPAGAE